MRPHRWQPIRLPHPCISPGKNIGVGCHFLLQCMKVNSESEVTQSCPNLHDPRDCSLPGSSIHGISRQKHWNGLPLPSPWRSGGSNYLRKLVQRMKEEPECHLLAALMTLDLNGKNSNRVLSREFIAILQS